MQVARASVRIRPFTMPSRRLGGTSALVAALGILLLVWPTAAPASAAITAPGTDTVFFSLLNAQRTLRGLGPLSLDGELSSISQSWSMTMARAGKLSHNPALRDLATQRGWARYGENVAFGTVASQIVTELVNSPVHAGNLFNPDFTRVGIGTVVDGQGLLWTTHVFVRPGGTPSPSPSPSPAPTVKAATPAQPTRAGPATRPGSTSASGSSALAPPPTAPASAGGTPTSVVALAPPPPQADTAGSGRTSEQLAVGPLAPASTTSDAGEPVLVSIVGGLLLLLVLGGAGFLFLRSSRSSSR